MAETPRSIVALTQDRSVALAHYGDPAGAPLFLFHGTPGSYKAGRLMDAAARENGFHVIAPERPGYGMSPAEKKSTLIQAAEDVKQIAESLNIRRFIVVGISGGGPYALASAALLPELVQAAGLISAMGPLYEKNSMQGMITPNRIFFLLARFSPGLSAWIIRAMTRQSLPSIQKHIDEGTSPSAAMAPETFRLLMEDQIEAISQGSQGIAGDLRRLWAPFGFTFEQIRVPVYIWYGQKDNLAPPTQMQGIAGRIPNAHLTLYPDDDHVTTWTNHANEILSTLGACID